MLYTAILGKGQYSNYSFYEMLTASKLLYCLESFRQPHKIIDIKIYKKIIQIIILETSLKIHL